MSLRLIKDDEQLVHDAQGAKIYYRRLPAHTRAGIVRRATKRGSIDWYGASIGFLEYCVLNWEGVVQTNGDGKEDSVAFTKDLIRYLPDETQSDLLELIGAPAEKLEGEETNLETTPGNKPKTTG